MSDHYGSLMFSQVVPADGPLIARPLHYYSGMTARLKAFFDRLLCYIAGAEPKADQVLSALPRKRIGLLTASGESHSSDPLGLCTKFKRLSATNAGSCWASYAHVLADRSDGR